MNDFSIIIPLKKDINSNQLTGIASTTSVDKDSEKMSDDALKSMVSDIKTQGVNLFGNHEHNWENTLGIINEANLVNNQVQVSITLDDASTNPKIPMLLNKLKKGIKLGLSVGGNVTGFKWEYDRTVGKKIKVLDQVKIYEVSVVGIPSNSDSFLSIPMAIAKSARLSKSPKCPKCGSDNIQEARGNSGDYHCSECDNVFHMVKSAKITKGPSCRNCGADLGSDPDTSPFCDDECEAEYNRKHPKNKACPLCYSETTKGVCQVCLTKI